MGDPAPAHMEISTDQDQSLIIRFSGKMDRQSAPTLIKEARAALRDGAHKLVNVDLREVSFLDDYGALVLFEMREIMKDRGGEIQVHSEDKNIHELIDHTHFDPNDICQSKKVPRSYNMVVRIGEAAIREALDLRFMLAFLGQAAIAMGRVIKKPKNLRVEDTLTYMEKTGVDALPIIALISFLLGLIMAFMASIQFRQFGADIYVASLVAFAMVSELGPVMTAIVVSGRSGSAFAAEISAMKISEEIDALITMGFDPVLFLVVPRLVASVTVVPLLYLFSVIVAVAGGLTVGVFMLGLSTNTYMRETLDILTLTEILWGFGKSCVFAALIAWVGCLRGFQATGGASAVGNAATSAVVSSIFLVILFDSVFAIIRIYW